ncbi:hypothetical protein BH09PAT1_BH09PAT1_5000 [soil metagenome]
MERFTNASQFIKKEAIARTAGSLMVGLGSSGDIPFHADSTILRPTPIVRTMEGMKISSPRNDFYKIDKEIENIDRIRSNFDRTVRTDTKNKLLSWDPVKSRNRYEQCQTPQERLSWQKNERREITTSLRERYNCLENPMDLYIDEEGFLRNKLFPRDTLETILMRGVAYQETHGSKELERERSEVIGILEVQEALTSSEAQDGETRCIISGPGLVEGSPYTKRFFDRYTLKIDPLTGEREVDAKRYSTDMTYEENIKLALVIDPHYFDGEEGPIDAIFLRKPLNLDGIEDIDSFLDSVLTFDPDALKGFEYQIIDDRCDPVIQTLIQAMINFKPEEIVRILNTIFHMGDEVERLIKQNDTGSIQALLDKSREMTSDQVQNEVTIRGNQVVETRQVGCGDSGSLSNSVGQFGFSAENDPNLKCFDAECITIAAHFHCPGEKSKQVEEEGKWVRKKVPCKESIRVGKGITICPACGEGKKC